MDGIEETFFSQNLNDTKLFAKKIAKNLKPGDIVAFIGYLATGKTTLIKEIAQALKTKEAVSSPTFSYLNIYNAKYTIYHFDLYRLKNYDHFQCELRFDFLHAVSLDFQPQYQFQTPCFQLFVLQQLHYGQS